MPLSDRLIALEARFAPKILTGRPVFSPLDPNNHAPWELGGDKMHPDRHGYAKAYEEVLSGLRPWVVVELGVFLGASLAMWDALWPDAEIIGLDLDFSRFWEHLPELYRESAFPELLPSLVEFDAYGPVDPLLKVLDGRSIDVFVDDGPHTEDAIRRVAGMVAPLMAERSVYVVEDFRGGARILTEAFPDARILSYGEWSAAVQG